MNLKRIIFTISCFSLFVTAAVADEQPVFIPRFYSGISAAGCISSSSGFPAGFQAGGSILAGAGMNVSSRLGIEATAGVSGMLRSAVTGRVVYNGYAGFYGGVEGFYHTFDFNRDALNGGISAGVRGNWMSLSMTGHFFFFPDASLGMYLNLPPPEYESWYLRLGLTYHQHFRRDLAYCASLELSLSVVQEGL